MHSPRKITLEYQWNGKDTKKTVEFIPATGEQFVVKEVLVDEIYNFDLKGDDTVLNIGGHIGTFDIFAFDRVREIVTYEPMQSDFEKLQKHIVINKIENVRAINKAVVAEKVDIIKFYTTQSGHHSTLPGGNEIEVSAEYIGDIYESHQFTKIKCDCEGGEYSIFSIPVPISVNEIWMETHTRDHDFLEKHRELIANFERQGFKVEEIKNDEQDRTFLLHCKR